MLDELVQQLLDLRKGLIDPDRLKENGELGKFLKSLHISCEDLWKNEVLQGCNCFKPITLKIGHHLAVTNLIGASFLIR